ncbi:hypothetical protein Lal_00000030 [Lupinus albus]|nr:hypothetical protein Lal_00000030 [Lupinus albus]
MSIMSRLQIRVIKTLKRRWFERGELLKFEASFRGGDRYWLEPSRKEQFPSSSINVIAGKNEKTEEEDDGVEPHHHSKPLATFDGEDNRRRRLETNRLRLLTSAIFSLLLTSLFFSLPSSKLSHAIQVKNDKPKTNPSPLQSVFVAGPNPSPEQDELLSGITIKNKIFRFKTFDPIPVTYAELFAHLQTERILAPIAGQTPNTTAPWYDPNANCDYHSGIIGHSTETCRALKHRIQDLIDSKWLEFKDTVPTITGNPLPNHGNQGINVLEQDDDMAVVEKVEDMKTPLKVIFKVLCQQGLVDMVGEGAYEDDVCLMHGILDHTLETCTEFKALVQRLLHSRLLMIEKKVKGSDIFVLERDQKIQDRIITRRFVPVLNIPDGTPSYTAPPRWIPRSYIESGATRHPGPFPYKSDKAVPWKYQGKSVAKSKQTEEVVNLAGVGNMTRSGRVYSPVELSKKIINASKGKEKIVETSEDRPEPEYGQGMKNTLVLPSNSGRAGLGYSPSNYQEEASEDKEGGVAQLDTIAMVEDGQLESDLGPVYQCIPGTGLSNWTEEDVASDVYYAM